MKGEVSSYIIVIGIMVLAASMLTAAGVYLDSITLPLSSQQATNGSAEQISGELASMADQCWNQADQGQSAAALDCFEIRVDAQENVTESLIREQVGSAPSDRVRLTATIEEGQQTTLHVTYNPDDQVITIDQQSVCEPSSDTCEDSACQCGPDQYCAPGDPGADALGCVDEFTMNVPTNPCDSEWCSS